MTKVYLVRHAKPDFNIHDDNLRPLTSEGINDSKKVTEFLLDKGITKVYSSPYKRAVDTIKDFADKVGIEIEIINDFRERKVDSVWIDNFNEFTKKQWEDFNYKLSDGECLFEVQKRNIAALKKVLIENIDNNIVIGTHGTALSTIINYYNKDFNHKEFERIKYFMPYIVYIEFEGLNLIKIEEIDILNGM